MHLGSKSRSMEILRPILLVLNNTDEHLLYRETSGAFFQPLLCHLMCGTIGSSSKGSMSTKVRISDGEHRVHMTSPTIENRYRGPQVDVLEIVRKQGT
jgi:hypothetical protein